MMAHKSYTVYWVDSWLLVWPLTWGERLTYACRWLTRQRPQPVYEPGGGAALEDAATAAEALTLARKLEPAACVKYGTPGNPGQCVVLDNCGGRLVGLAPVSSAPGVVRAYLAGRYRQRQLDFN